MGFSGGLDGKESTCNAGDPDLIPGLGRSLGKGNDNPLQYSCLGSSINRGAWQATVHEVKKELDRTKRTHTHTHTHTPYLEDLNVGSRVNNNRISFHCNDWNP